MISYTPLLKTLEKRKKDVYWLQGEIGNHNLRSLLNANRYVGLETIDRICNVLGCKVGDVIEYREGVQDIKDIRRGVIVELDPEKLKSILLSKYKSPKEASLACKKSEGYFASLLNRRKVKSRTAREICKMIGCSLEDITKGGN